MSNGKATKNRQRTSPREALRFRASRASGFRHQVPRNVFNKQHLDAMHRILADVCQDFEAGLVEFNGEHDHVHLLVNYPPKVALSKLVASLKGVSSRLLRQQFGDFHPWLKRRGVLWSPSYFAVSCGGAPIDILRQYIEQEQTPHQGAN
jgi:putative transposase